MIASYTAKRRGYDNTPSAKIINNLQTLCEQILQPIRDEWRAPIIVGSGYRCPKLNAAVGGVKNSDHLYGCAADIHTLGDLPANNYCLFLLVQDMVKRGELPMLKQLIDEYNYDWLHISFQDGRTKKYGQILHIK